MKTVWYNPEYNLIFEYDDSSKTLYNEDHGVTITFEGVKNLDTFVKLGDL